MSDKTRDDSKMHAAILPLLVEALMGLDVGYACAETAL